MYMKRCRQWGWPAPAARALGGPTLIEGYTYRLGAHTTSDDPSRYRAESEVERWRALDPLLRLERYLKARGLLREEEVQDIREKCLARAQAEFEQAERLNDPTLEDTYQFMFHELPQPLRRQLARRRAVSTRPCPREASWARPSAWRWAASSRW